MLAAKGFWRDDALFAASALAFDTVLAIVPLVALVLATLKGFGAYSAVVEDTLLPWLDGVFATLGGAGSPLQEALLDVIALAAGADFKALGAFGLVLVLLLAGVLLSTIESTLNRIRGVRQPRTPVRKLADYAAILFVVPLLLVGVAGLTAWVVESSLSELARAVLVQGVTLLAAGTLITFLYVVMPATRTRWPSAILGGAVAAVLWYVAFVAWASFQIGMARYGAIYSGLAAVPLFIVWVFVSWLIILLGAELAAAHHDERGFRWRIRHRHTSVALRRFIAVRFLVQITRAFLDAAPPRTLAGLASEAGVPGHLAREVLDLLVAEGLLVASTNRVNPAYAPCRDLAELHVMTVLEMVASGDASEDLDLGIADAEGTYLAGVIRGLEEAAETSDFNGTLGQLARRGAERAPAEARLDPQA